MKLLFLPLLVSSIAFADVDTLYSVSFSDPGGEWSWGSSWEVCPDFIQLYLSHYNYSGYAEESDSLSRQSGYVVPLNPDSLVLEFDHFWHAWGFSDYYLNSASGLSSFCMRSGSADPWSGLWTIEAGCGGSYYDSFDATDSGTVICSCPEVSLGDTLFFRFSGEVSTFSYCTAGLPS